MSDQLSSFDTAIIGGGVIGCSIAWRLAQGGQRVVVIERGEPGKEASWAAGGMLAPLAEADRADEFFQLCVASRALYADFAQELREAVGLDIEYRTEGTLYLALTNEDEEELEQRWAWQHAAGLNVKKLKADCVRKLEPLVNETLRWALKFPDDHQVNNRRLAEALHAAARKAGVQFRPFTEARDLLTEPQAGQTRLRGVNTTRGEIRAATVVIAAGAWAGLLPATTLPITPVRGQMIALEMPAPGLNHVIYSRRGYVVPRSGGFVIAGSTTENAGFDKRVTAEGLAAIIQKAAEIAPRLQTQAITETWAGLRPHGLDDQPILGADSQIQGLVYATAHYRNGILLTPITAQTISELILKGESALNLAPFNLARFPLQQHASTAI
jgi:glycine oxidase